MDVPTFGGSAAAVKAAVVTVVALPILVASAPLLSPPTGEIVGREQQPAITGATTGRNFLISSDVPTLLFPGATVPVNLTLSNPNTFGIEIRTLTIRIEKVDAGTGCRVDDFGTRQFSGSYGLQVHSTETTDLDTLGIEPGNWPQVMMIDKSQNQDGCKGVVVELSLGGTAVALQS
jgi:hypothetical protein